MKKKNYYYDIRNLLKQYPDAQYYMAFGERSNGKTYSALDLAITNYFKKGEQFAYIRRFGEDIKPKNMKSIFAPHITDNKIADLSSGEYNLVTYRTSRFYPAYWDEKASKPLESPNPMGYAFDLNATEHTKSTSYPKVTTVIFDEFLSRQGYLANEFVLFMNTLSTIIRDRKDVKIIMLGNTVNKYCPYFQEMGLSHIKDQEPGTVDLYTYGDTGLTVVVEYCESMSKRGKKESDVYFAFDNPQLKMITTGSWEIAIYPHLPKKYRPIDVVHQFFISFQDQLLHAELVVDDEGYFLFIHPKTTPLKDDSTDILFTDIPSHRWNVRVGFNGGDELSKLAKKLINTNRIFYSDNETGEILRNYILWSENYSSIRR